MDCLRAAVNKLRRKSTKPKTPSASLDDDKFDNLPDTQGNGEFEGQAVICDLALTGKCDGLACGRDHVEDSNLPYLWQANMFGGWIALPSAECIERSFCALKDFSDPVFVESANGHVSVFFYGEKIEGHLQCDRKEYGQPIEARRISTASYSTGDITKDSYLTQWRWYWKDNDGIWRLYQPDTMQYTLETKYLAGQRQYQFSRDNFWIMINFLAMTQTNIETGKVRNILRRPLLVTTLEVSRGERPSKLQPFPPIDVHLPHGWVPWDHTSPFELVNLSTDSTEYNDVAAIFFLTLSEKDLKLDHVYRVQNHSQWDAFCRKEHDMETMLQRTHPGKRLDKRNLFHGTDTQGTARGICTHNFDHRVSGKNATKYGDGAYFATDSKYSHCYTKGPKRFMFVAHVLVGHFALGEEGYRRPPAMPHGRHELYDSCVNDLNNPTMFILFDKCQHYPAYLIEYSDV